MKFRLDIFLEYKKDDLLGQHFKLSCQLPANKEAKGESFDLIIAFNKLLMQIAQEIKLL